MNLTFSTIPVSIGVNFVFWILASLSGAFVITFFLVQPIFSWGFHRYVLNEVDGRGRFEDLFSGFSDLSRVWFPAFGVQLFETLIMAVFFVPPALVGELLGLPAVGEFIGVAALLVVYPRFSMAMFIAIEDGLSPVDAIAASWRMTEGNGVKVALLIVLLAFASLTGFLACLVGYVFTAMAYDFGYAAIYRQLRPATVPAGSGAEDLGSLGNGARDHGAAL